ncbi:hypothetical protein C8J56DRAFT_885852 [Mycena floridula]|nr:hypothetical protein C8J56DRAFT_885852 [Mycena floridula]
MADDGYAMMTPHSQLNWILYCMCIDLVKFMVALLIENLSTITHSSIGDASLLPKLYGPEAPQINMEHQAVMDWWCSRCHASGTFILTVASKPHQLNPINKTRQGPPLSNQPLYFQERWTAARVAVNIAAHAATFESDTETSIQQTNASVEGSSSSDITSSSKIPFIQWFNVALQDTVSKLGDIETMTPNDTFMHHIKNLLNGSTVLDHLIADTDKSLLEIYISRHAIMQIHLNFELQIQSMLLQAINKSSDGADGWLSNLLCRIEASIGINPVLCAQSALCVSTLPSNVVASVELPTSGKAYGLPPSETQDLTTFGSNLDVILLLPLVWEAYRNPVKLITMPDCKNLTHGALSRFCLSLENVRSQCTSSLVNLNTIISDLPTTKKPLSTETNSSASHLTPFLTFIRDTLPLLNIGHPAVTLLQMPDLILQPIYHHLRAFKSTKSVEDIHAPTFGDLGVLLFVEDLVYAGWLDMPSNEEFADCVAQIDKGAVEGLQKLGLVHSYLDSMLTEDIVLHHRKEKKSKSQILVELMTLMSSMTMIDFIVTILYQY